MEFSQKLKELRGEKGLTQDQLAAKSNLSHGCIAMLELGKRAPTGVTLLALSDALECSVDYLLGREDDFGNVTVQTAGTQLTTDEEKLLATYRKLTEKNKMHVSAYAQVRLEEQDGGAPSSLRWK